MPRVTQIVRRQNENRASLSERRVLEEYSQSYTQFLRAFIELVGDSLFNTQSRCCLSHRQHICSHARVAKGLRKKVSSMKKENTLLTERIIQLAQCEADAKVLCKGQAEIQEMFKRFLFGQNTGAVPNGDVVKACTEEKDDKKEATRLYFRVGGRIDTPSFSGIEVGKWLAIPPRDCVVSKGCISPFFLEPPRDLGFTPLAIGPFIFLISDVMEGSVEEEKQPFRYVHYLNTQNVKETEGNPWKVAPRLVVEHAQLCHFLVARDMIYSFGFLKNGSLCVNYINCKEPNEGWNALECKKVEALESNKVEPLESNKVEPCSSEDFLSSFCYIPASTIEFVSTDGRTRAQRALIFSAFYVLTFELDTGNYEVSENHGVFRFNEILCSLFCPDGGLFYLLIQDLDDRFSLVVYNHHGRGRGFTKVFGLDDYLPEDTGRLPVLRLVHLGNRHLCLVWPHGLGANTEVRCTKFTVEKAQRKYHATIVSSQAYRVKCFSLDNFEAVVVNEMILENAEDNALGLGARKGKETMGAKQRWPDYEITTS